MGTEVSMGDEEEPTDEVELRRVRGTSARGGEEAGKAEEVWRARALEGEAAGLAEERIGVETIDLETEARRPELTTFVGGPKSSSSASIPLCTISSVFCPWLNAFLYRSCI